MSVYDLYQSYLNQAADQEAAALVNPTLMPVLPQTGGGEGIMGIGTFGNLDPNTIEMTNIDVYDPEQGFRTQTVPTALNLTSGLRQTMEGKNAMPMFSNTGPRGILGMVASKLGFGTPKGNNPFTPGSIRGRFDTFADFFSGNRVGSVPTSVMGMENPANFGVGFGAGGVNLASLMDDFGFNERGPGGGFSDGTSSAADGGEAGAAAASAAGANDGPDTGGSF